MMKEESENQMLIPIYPEDRVHYLIRMFLTEEDYIKMEDICDRIFVSRSTLSSDLKEVREKLKYFEGVLRNLWELRSVSYENILAHC